MDLRLGSTGEDVVKLQKRLGLDPIGKFGPKTDELVRRWQSENGLKVDGVVGNITWGKLFSEGMQSKPTLITEPGPSSFGGTLKIENLRGHVPLSVLEQIPEILSAFNINTPLRLAHFLSQCSHESMGFKVTQENLNYSSKGLMGTFRKYFPNETLAKQYERKPELIASKVYGNRMGNGPESTKEGYKYRGRGFMQLTGKDNYKSFGRVINEDLTSNPERVANEFPLLSAAWFFSERGLNKIADQGSNVSVITKVTKIINGGTNGLDDRIHHFNKFYDLLT